MGARYGMCRDRRGRQRDNRSKELRPTRRQKKKKSREPSPTGAAKRQNIRRMIRSWMGGERVDIRDRRERVRGREDCDLEGAVVKPLAAIGIEIFLERAVVKLLP
ncbi:hypothetical protein TNCV_2680971 [Trichonephila clavipes]|uniref:Uncharacterized protein n=1 Tax=Trichonephila clavipes TaxID=2585209 RepID=A0A8X6VHK7_TRICX|nr:hypothetical protein TNCV_2680971 [Trichonephila clavipes]